MDDVNAPYDTGSNPVDDIAVPPEPVVVNEADISDEVVVDVNEVDPATVSPEVASEILNPEPAPDDESDPEPEVVEVVEEVVTPVPEDVEDDIPLEPDWADAPREPGPQAVKDVPRIAREVINGAWGEGDDRRVRLEALGYDIDEVKAEAVRQLGLD